MAAADVSALIDAASAPEVPESPVTEPVIEETPDVPEPSSESATETPDESNAEPDEPTEASVDGRTNPAAIRSALKAFRDLDPKNAPIARELNDAYGRYSAYKSVFPKVADAQNARAVLDAVGGHDGIASLQETIKSVNETDGLLYSGDPRVIDNLIEDFKSEGKLEAFGKLAAPFLDKLRTVDEKAYFSTLKPHFYQGLVDTQFPDVLGALTEALTGDQPNVAVAQKILSNLGTWFNKLRDSVEAGAKATLDPDRQAFEQERTQFQTEKQKEFENSVNSAWNSANSSALGGALKPFLKLPFAKNWTQATKISVGNELISTLLSELKADKSYQSQMDALWSQKTPDRNRILEFHKSKLDIVAKRIVKQVLEARYPGFAKSKITMAPKPGAGKPNAAPGKTAIPNQPTFVTSKPAWEEIDHTKDPNQHLYITGKAFLKNGKFVTWAKKR